MLKSWVRKEQLMQKIYWYTAKKMKFSIKDFFTKCDQIRSFLRFPAGLVTFTEEILNGKIDILCSDSHVKLWIALVFIEILDFRWILIIRDNFLEHFWGKDGFSSWYIGWSILLRLTIRCLLYYYGTHHHSLSQILKLC